MKRYLLAGAVVLAPVLQLAGMAPHPELGDTAAETLAVVAADPDGWFRMHALAAAAASLGVVAALAVASLVRGRGAALATVGATLSVVGLSLLVFGFAAEAQLMSLAAHPSLDPDAMAPLLDLQDEGPGMAMLMAGFPLSGVGTLLLMSGLLRAGVVPGWQPAIVVLGTLTSIAATPGLTIGPLLFLPGLVGWVAIARHVARSRPVGASELVLAA